MFRIIRSTFISSSGAASSSEISSVSSEDERSFSGREDSSSKTQGALPSEILKHIFSYLPIVDLDAVKQVSWTWHEVAHELTSNTSRLLGFELKDAKTDGATLLKTAQANPMLMHLRVIDCQNVTAFDLINTCSLLQNLRSVELSGENTYDLDVLKVLGERNILMKHLSITNISGSESLDIGPIFAILNHFKRLHSLHIHLPNKHFTEEHLNLISKNLTNLETFSFDAASGLHLTHIENIADQSPQLQKCTLTVAKTVKPKVAKKLLSRKCPHLHHVSITQNK